MKRNFTKLGALVVALGLSTTMVSGQDLTPGWFYGGTDIIVQTDFQDWESNHTTTDGKVRSTEYFDWEKPLTAGVTMKMIECAATPSFAQQLFHEGNENANNRITFGSLEVSRKTSNGTNNNKKEYDGSVVIGPFAYAKIVQYSYSSMGGNRRAITLQRSTDGGESWQDVRNPVAANNNSYEGSGLGLLVEDTIGESDADCTNVLLKFTINQNQDYRLHEIKVFDGRNATSINQVSINELGITPTNDYVDVSDVANIQIYNMNGALVKEQPNTTRLSTTDLPQGTYIVKAVSATTQGVAKFVRR